MLKPQQRILLCRPQGGLTDILSQIGKCCRYAAMFNRKVIVETDFSETKYFRDDFSHYFISHDRDLVLSSRTIASTFDDMNVFPPAFSGRINSYRAAYHREMGVFAEVDTSEVTSFDFDKNYNAQLLLHQSVGGGLDNATIALERLSITPMVRDIVEERFARIGWPYTGIHIRHTDYRTDYCERILALKTEISGRVFVATDNRAVLDFCRKVFGNERVCSFSNLPNQVGKQIHNSIELDARQSNIDAISDLLLLARAQKYYFFPILKDWSSAPSFSGFSTLADKLHKDRKLYRQFTKLDSFGPVSRLKLRIQKATYRLGEKWRTFVVGNF